MDVIKASLINEIQIRKEYMNVINQLKITYTHHKHGMDIYFKKPYGKYKINNNQIN
jgi:hypothetical protein